MLQENLRSLRKAKGLSQDDLAQRLHVVRQTVSKWEQGRSVPDADLLIRLAQILDTSVSRLLGPEIPLEGGEHAVAAQLAGINEQLAARNRRTRRVWIAICVAAGLILLFNAMAAVFGMVSFKSYTAPRTTVMVEQVPLPEGSGL